MENADGRARVMLFGACSTAGHFFSAVCEEYGTLELRMQSEEQTLFVESGKREDRWILWGWITV